MRILGEIKEVSKKYITAEMQLAGYLIYTEFPTDVINKKVKAKIGNCFYWKPSQYDKLMSEEFYPTENTVCFGTELDVDELEVLVYRLLEGCRNIQ